MSGCQYGTLLTSVPDYGDSVAYGKKILFKSVYKFYDEFGVFRGVEGKLPGAYTQGVLGVRRTPAKII